MTRANGYLLDTCILVHLLRGNTLGEAINNRYSLSSSMHRAVISVVTVGELRSLAGQLGWGEAKIAPMTAILSQVVQVDINHEDIITAYAAIDVHSINVGRPMGKNDLWIAATCVAGGFFLLTTDGDFDHLISSGMISGARLDVATGTPTISRGDS